MTLKKQTFLKGSLILMLSAAAAKLLGAFFKIPLTDILGGIGMSYFSTAYSLFMPIYAFTVTGISSSVARLTSRSAALGAFENVRKVHRTAFMIFSAAGVFGSLIIFLLAEPFSIISADSPEASLAVKMIAPSVLFGCITAVERGYYEGLSNMYPTAFSQVAEGIVKTAAGLFLCIYVTQNSDVMMKFFPSVSDKRAIAAAAGILGVTLSSFGAVLFLGVMRLFVHREVSAEKAVMGRKKIVRELVLTALPIGISAVVTNLTAIIDMWTLIGCIPQAEKLPTGISAAEYPRFVYGSFAGIALTVFNLIPSVTNMLGKGALTLTASDWENGDKEALHRDSMQALLSSAIISVPAAVGIGVLSEEILCFLFPHQLDEAAVCFKSLRILMAGMVCLCISYPLFSILQAIGKSGVPLKTMLIGTAVKLAGNTFLIPRMGVDGAALATTFCYIVILVLSFREFAVHTGVRPEMKPFLGVLYSGAMCGGTAYLAKSAAKLHGMGNFWTIALSAAAGGAVYICCLGVSFRAKKKACIKQA